MEFDSLKSLGYNTNPGTDYASKGASNVTVDRPADTGATSKPKTADGNKTVSGGKNIDMQNMPVSAEVLRDELVELQESISNEFFDKFIQEANKKIFASNRQFSYSIHDATNRVSVKVIDTTTKEVIREIPPEKTLDAAAKMLELVGVIFDERV